MLLSIKDVLREYELSGDVILYRDKDHRKKKMLEYVVKKMGIEGGKPVVTYSDGAFALYLARALPNNEVHACFSLISPDYGELMESTPNLILHPGMMKYGSTVADYLHFCSENPEFIEVDQTNNVFACEYYEKYFSNIVSATSGLKIDAFCDCGHSFNTLRGFMQSGLVDWEFIIGTTDLQCLVSENPDILDFSKFDGYRDTLVLECATMYDTYELGKLVERRHPDFGNVYESTRSISAALAYLKKHPGKTVLVYVGDSFEREGTKFNETSLSVLWSKGLYYLSNVLNSALNGFNTDSNGLKKYFELYCDKFGNNRKFIFSKLLSLYFRYLFDFNRDVDVEKSADFINNIILTSGGCIEDSTIDLLEAMFACVEGTLTKEEYIDNLWKAVLNDYGSGKDFILEFEASRCINILLNSGAPDFNRDEKISDILAKCNKLSIYLRSLGLC